MKFGFVAYDKGPSGYNKLIANRLSADGHEVVFIPAQERDIVGKYGIELDCCHLVVIGGPASLETQEEVAVVGYLSELPRPVPFVVLEDVPGSSLRPKFKGVAPWAQTVIIAMREWRQQILDFGYRYANYCGGLPQHWKVAFDTLGSVKDMRSVYTKKRGADSISAPLLPQNKILFYGCVKDGGTNNAILALMREAARADLGDTTVIGFKTRSDERITPEQQRARDEMLGDPLLWQLEFGVSSMSEIMSAADICVFSGGATDSIVCALARKPAIYCTGMNVRRLNAEQGVPDNGTWFVEKLGGAIVVNMDAGSDDFVRATLALEGLAFQRTLREQQQKHFPVPHPWSTDTVVASLLVSIARSEAR